MLDKRCNDEGEWMQRYADTLSQEHAYDGQTPPWSRGLGRALFVSPHLDDAVLACGDLLSVHPGACVLTVFAGAPDAAPLTDWDRLCGFERPDEVMPRRKEEDRRALSLLDAYPEWLGYLDAQYGRQPSLQALADTLCERIERFSPDAVAFPLGLFHDDHRLVAEALLAAGAGGPGRYWLLYADALYRSLPDLIGPRVDELRQRAFELTPLDPLPITLSKRRAVGCYASQLRALATPGHVPIEQAFLPEAYWALRRGG
jgi:LmbE family N-acetylglucosaminyl deacetylase